MLQSCPLRLHSLQDICFLSAPCLCSPCFFLLHFSFNRQKKFMDQFCSFMAESPLKSTAVLICALIFFLLVAL